MSARHLILGWVMAVIGMTLVSTQTNRPVNKSWVCESNPDVEHKTVAGTITPDNTRARMTNSNIEGILAFDRLNVWLSERSSVEGVRKSIVLQSSDGGRTWMESFSTYKAEYFLSLQSLNKEHVVAIATTLDWKNQLLRSLNGGESWNSLLRIMRNYCSKNGLLRKRCCGLHAWDKVGTFVFRTIF